MTSLDRDDGKSSRPKVLIVDDTPANVRLAVAVLAKLPVDVLTASSGAQALALATRRARSTI
jgi:CheY-like chemotaxis protein